MAVLPPLYQHQTLHSTACMSRWGEPRGRPQQPTILQVWLKQPLVNLTDIQERHNIVDALVEDPLLRERLRNLHLRGACPAKLSDV